MKLRARQKLGKYRILGRIATGPLADVYRAYDSIQKINVALKIPKIEGNVGYDEVLHEVRVATKLKHPNILSVLNASYIDDHFVIAMELGQESLAGRIERRTSIARLLDLAGQGLAGLAHAHDHNIIHCDIKPENFILFPGHQLKLADFGFAKISLRTLKASGSGTIDYIAPEQAMGRPKFQSDVFSMGLVLYRMFSGKLPGWPFEWPMIGLDKLEARLRPELIAVLRKAIQLDPKKRYRNAVEMQSDFLRSQSHTRKQKRPKARNGSRRGTSWRQLQWRQFQSQFRKVLDTHHHCRRCEGPVSESMKACPWCGFDNPARGCESKLPASCPRCEPGFVEETTRRYPDKRYSARCANERCEGPLMPFMRYCPWCKTKVRRAWKLKGSKHSCRACEWGIAKEFWNYCAWCREPVRQE